MFINNVIGLNLDLFKTEYKIDYNFHKKNEMFLYLSYSLILKKEFSFRDCIGCNFLR